MDQASDPRDLVPARRKDYTHSYWKNCWRRYPDNDKSPDILCFESGRYGLTFNTASLTSVKYTLFDDDKLSYTDAMAFENRGRMDALDDMNLVVEVRVDNKTYRAKSARPVNKEIGLCHARLWEAGRIAQHYELVGVILEDVSTSEIEDTSHLTLQCNASIYIVAWPQEFAITLSLQPPENVTWQSGATIRVRLGDWSTQQLFSGPWVSTQTQEVTLSCNVIGPSCSSAKLQDEVTFEVHNKSASPQAFDVSYNTHFSCFVADIKHPKRNFPSGYTEIRDADIFNVQIDNASTENVYIPVMFYVLSPANITGLVPMLWVPEDETNDNSYVPSGIPVQTSKNWHYRAMGNYLRAFAIIPTKPGKQNLELRVYYGFYGPLCSASHSNLSLVGWPKYEEYSTAGRWEQLAIGCSGETFCIDIEMSATNQTITDVRALMVRKDIKWRWTNAGWGGDWLCVYDDAGRKLLLGGVKVGYVSQGPCLTDVNYIAYYGSNAEVYVDATVHTLRTNDYARTIQKIRYDFNSTVAFTNRLNTPGSCLFRVGGGAAWEGWYCERVALGNGDGLLEDLEVPSSIKVGDFFVDRKELTGPDPWWIAFPESGFTSDQGDMGIAWKCLIIRSFDACVDGVTLTSPSVSLYVRQHHDGGYYIDAMLTLNAEISAFNKGDRVSFGTEWITVPYNANDYYGDNKAFQQQLQDSPKSWKTAFREAVGNKLSVSVEGGNIVSMYPLVISATDSVIKLDIKNGVGAVPVRFEGLDSRKYQLIDDTQAERNDQWYETSFCPESQYYSMTFNLLLDERPETSWTLK
eukprot:CCRYP_008242-RA/>CCRYP_008242-RA protein AED:0.02 eAED:0.02 QI:498/1/1/1/1/1/2/95/802